MIGKDGQGLSIGSTTGQQQGSGHEQHPRHPRRHPCPRAARVPESVRHHLMIEELQKMMRRIEDARALIVCHPDDQPTVQTAIRGLDAIAPNVQVNRWVKPGEILIFPSRAEFLDRPIPYDPAQSLRRVSRNSGPHQAGR
jgi:hypothetical protein